MRAQGIADETIQTIVWDNPVAFFSQSGNLDLSEMDQAPRIDRSLKFADNSVLRGEPAVPR